jgi:hypothetical protein
MSAFLAAPESTASITQRLAAARLVLERSVGTRPLIWWNLVK